MNVPGGATRPVHAKEVLTISGQGYHRHRLLACPARGARMRAQPRRPRRLAAEPAQQLRQAQHQGQPDHRPTLCTAQGVPAASRNACTGWATGEASPPRWPTVSSAPPRLTARHQPAARRHRRASRPADARPLRPGRCPGWPPTRPTAPASRSANERRPAVGAAQHLPPARTGHAGSPMKSKRRLTPAASAITHQLKRRTKNEIQDSPA